MDDPEVTMLGGIIVKFHMSSQACGIYRNSVAVTRDKGGGWAGGRSRGEVYRHSQSQGGLFCELQNRKSSSSQHLKVRAVRSRNPLEFCLSI